MKNEEKDKSSSSIGREEIEKQFPNLKIVDATEEMIGKTSLFTWCRPFKQRQNEGTDFTATQKHEIK